MIRIAIEVLRSWGVDPGFFRLLDSHLFRALMGMGTALVFSLLFGWRTIAVLYRRRYRDTSGEFLSLSTHSKQGTPTAGGLLIILSCLAGALMWGDVRSLHMIVLMGGFLYLGLVGFIDDSLKIRFKSSLSGLGQLAKTILILGFSVPFSYLLVSPAGPIPEELRTRVILPFFKNPLIDLGALGFFVFAVFGVFAIINAVNITDGMDGLLCGTSALAVAVYMIFAYILSSAILSSYLLFPMMPGAQELVIFGAALVGAILGFLWYNAYPAEVFMGDTGALPIGGTLAMMAFLLRQEMLFPIVGGVFVLEIFTSLLQDKLGNRMARRFVLRAPFHHALSHRGMSEPKSVIRLWIAALFLAGIGLLSLKIR